MLWFSSQLYWAVQSHSGHGQVIYMAADCSQCLSQHRLYSLETVPYTLIIALRSLGLVFF